MSESDHVLRVYGRDPENGARRDPSRDVRRLDRRSQGKEAPMLKLTVRYARYVLSTLSTVAFGMSMN